MSSVTKGHRFLSADIPVLKLAYKNHTSAAAAADCHKKHSWTPFHDPDQCSMAAKEEAIATGHWPRK